MTLNYPGTKVLSEMVAAYCQETPGKIAINDGKTQFSYKALSDISDNLAKQFIAAGIKKGDRVCLVAKKCAEIIPYAIGIWKAGAVYTPLDYELPPERFENILSNIMPFALIYPQSESKRMENVEVPLKQTFESCHIPVNTGDVLLPEVNEDDNAVIIHTSGSTGLPKGVVLQHKSLVAYFNSHRQVFNTTHESRCLSTASFHFDVSIQDTFLPLFFGAYIYVFRSFFIPELVLPLIQKEKFTIITAVSTIFALITGDLANLDKYSFPDLKFVSMGAEVCPVKLVNKWLETQPGLVVINNYGPSEVNSATVCYRITKAEANRESYYPIGKPNAGVKSVLVNDNREVITTAHTDGELYLGGLQLMHYYWNNPQATENAFDFIDGEKYYKTGDICFYDEQQNLVYNGRKDFEVKFNGRRINMLEITGMVQERFPVKSVEGHHTQIEGRHYLMLLMQVDNYEGLHTLKEEMVKYLREKLPAHSIPNVFSFFDVPVQTSSGKTNKKLLAESTEDALKKNTADLFFYQDNEFVKFKQ
jgi:D-alanine--poly(phosphoribitol) ligase subunit 1